MAVPGVHWAQRGVSPQYLESQPLPKEVILRYVSRGVDVYRKEGLAAKGVRLDRETGSGLWTGKGAKIQAQSREMGEGREIAQAYPPLCAFTSKGGFLSPASSPWSCNKSYNCEHNPSEPSSSPPLI